MILEEKNVLPLGQVKCADCVLEMVNIRSGGRFT